MNHETESLNVLKMRLKHYTAFLMIGVALISCDHKNLCYMDMSKSKIEVVYDWRDAPEANPSGMCVFFYSTDDDGVYYRFDFDNSKGGEIEIPQGHYKLITYNNDTELTRFSGTNQFDCHTAYTRDGDLLEPLYGNGVSSTVETTNGERVCITPDGLWGCHAMDVTINPHGVTYTYIPYYDSRGCDCGCGSTDSGVQTITLYPHDLLCHYSYEVRHVENAEYISKISASLSYMAPTLNLSDESLGSEDITLPFGGKVDSDAKKVTGQFLTFGASPDTSLPHKMAFFVVMKDGSKYRIEGDDNLDVSDQVNKAPDKRHVHIIIDNLKVPGPKESDSGWDPTVDDWGIWNEEIHL